MREVINEVSIEVSTETPKTMLKIPRILIAAPSSGSGKTLFTCALLRLLQRKGIRAAAFKCGPDYIDPMFHRDVLGTPSRNLDLYLAGEEGVRRSLAAGFREANAEIAVIEGVMGYLDGTGESGLTGSSYHLAVSTHTPVILTVNARGMSRSAAALVKGFAEYGTDRQIKGLFLNRVSQPSAGMIANWIREDTDLPVLASLPQEKAITFTSRHLGLIEPGEIPDLQNRIERAADLLEETMDLDQLLAIARSAPDVSAPVDTGHTKAVPSDRTGAKAGGTELQTQDPHSPVTIAVAMDEAFSFYYEDNLELLASYGAHMRTTWNCWRRMARRSFAFRPSMTAGFRTRTGSFWVAAIRSCGQRNCLLTNPCAPRSGAQRRLACRSSRNAADSSICSRNWRRRTEPYTRWPACWMAAVR